jgi:hypothetical protein|tara:strand:+ start:31697 stop:32062 length:366 start_codon:yes stop_codon:yes gene_type:complete
MSHAKSSTFEHKGKIIVANTSGFRSDRAAVNAATSSKNRKRTRTPTFPDTEDGEVAAQNYSKKRSSKTDDTQQRNSEGRKENFSRIPHHDKHLSKEEEKKVREGYRKRKRKRPKPKPKNKD